MVSANQYQFQSLDLEYNFITHTTRLKLAPTDSLRSSSMSFSQIIEIETSYFCYHDSEKRLAPTYSGSRHGNGVNSGSDTLLGSVTLPTLSGQQNSDGKQPY